MRTALCMLAGVFTLLHAAPTPAADGLIPAPDSPAWARWQGRLAVGSSLPSPGLGSAFGDTAGRPLNSFSLMGDYYFTRSSAGSHEGGGFRATSGVIIGTRGPLGAAQPGFSSGSPFSVGRPLFGPSAAASFANDPTANDPTTTAPYVGVGYTGLSARAGWSFNADVGLAALLPTNSVKLGRAFNTNPTLDDQVRDVRLAPVLQLGVSYAF